MKPYDILFFVGTEAELIKIFPVMLEVEKMGMSYAIIASGQNDINESFILNKIVKRSVDLELSKESDIKKSALGLMAWFAKTNRKVAKEIRSKIPYNDKTIVVVHGDTVSTVMGALAGRKLGLRVAHVEAGLRSFNWMNPFPEEIDRSIVSSIARIHFAPGELACKNLGRARAKGEIVDTRNNTLLDSLSIAQTLECKSAQIEALCNKRHYVLVVHRQENLANAELVEKLVEVAYSTRDDISCVFIMHEPTRIKMIDGGYMEQLEEHPSIELLPRVEYCDFMKLLGSAEYVLTDGGSNQEELYYMGVPCMILRSHTERHEGLGHNAILMKEDVEEVGRFLASYGDYRREPLSKEGSPSKVIAERLHSLSQGQ